MKHWNELDGSVFFGKVFSFPVAIGLVDLFALHVDNNRPSITVEFDMQEMPDILPEKWRKAEFNTCRIGISCGNFRELEIKGIPTNEKLNVDIAMLAGEYRVRMSNKDSLIFFSTRHVSLCGPSVYFNARVED